MNVYVLRADDGLTLIDGGWAIPEARDVFERSLRLIDSGFADIRSFLVTHAHRDHYSMARTLGTELGIHVTLGSGEKAGLEAMQRLTAGGPTPFVQLLTKCGAHELAEQWSRKGTTADADSWRDPDSWLDEGPVDAGRRSLEAIHTPGHTPGHFVFADRDAGLLFAGDHILPTITPSIGFVHPTPDNPLADFMASLAKVRALPDLRILPAHGPLAHSSHARADELLMHHGDRLRLCLEVLGLSALTALQVAAQLPWTRRGREYYELDSFNQGMAVLETHAHLQVLTARGESSCATGDNGATIYRRQTHLSTPDEEGSSP